MKTSLGIFSLVFRHELRVLSADRTLWLVSALLLALLGYSLYNGIVETKARDRAMSEIALQQEDKQKSNIDALRKVMAGGPVTDPFANPVDPAAIGSGMGGRYAIMPTAPLAPLAFGQSDMYPNSYKVTYRSKVTFMYDSEIGNPWNLLSGHADLAFVLTYLLPLLIFALSYNLLSAEREQGTLKMLLSQPLTPLTLVAGKLAARAAVLLPLAVVVPAVVLLLARPEARSLDQLGPLLAWMALITVYGLFWFALAVLVNALGKSSAANILILIASWVALVLVAPVVLNLAVQTAHPVPSRAELATTTRIITIKGLNRYHDLLSADYRYTAQPETLRPRNGKIEVPPRRRAQYLIQRDVDQEIQAVLDRFNAQILAQQTLVDRYGVISPAIVVYEGMTALAGTDSKRYLHFQNLVEQFHNAWKTYFDPRILDGIAITEADFERMPRFEWREPAEDGTSTTTMLRVLYLAVPTLLLITLAAWRLSVRPFLV